MPGLTEAAGPATEGLPPTDPANEQMLLDLRMEYPLLVSAGFTLANMYWLGYGAFFALNTLLATALGASYSDRSSSLSAVSLKIIRVAIPVTGIVISCIAIYAAYLIASFTRTVIARGTAIDAILNTRMFRPIKNHSRPFPWATSIGSALFAVLWIAALISALS